MQPLVILQQIAAKLDAMDQPETVHRAMDEVEFVFELLPPELQQLAEDLLQKLRQRLQQLESGPAG